jgi:hypothetical protein
MALLIDGQPLDADQEGLYDVRSFVTALYPKAKEELFAEMSHLLAGNTADHVDAIVEALVVAKRLKNDYSIQKRLSYEDEFDASDASEEPEEPDEVPVIGAADVQAFSAALSAVQGSAECVSVIRPLLMAAVERFGTSLHLSASSEQQQGFSVSQRADHLGIDVRGSPSAIGKRAAELYHERYGRMPPRRWATLANGKGCRVYYYNEAEALATLDVALRESLKKRKQ